MSRRGLPTLWLVAALAVPGLGAPARLPIPAVDAVVAAMLGGSGNRRGAAHGGARRHRGGGVHQLLYEDQLRAEPPARAVPVPSAGRGTDHLPVPLRRSRRLAPGTTPAGAVRERRARISPVRLPLPRWGHLAVWCARHLGGDIHRRRAHADGVSDSLVEDGVPARGGACHA